MSPEPGWRRSEALGWLLLALALAGGVLLVYAPLLLTNRVLATGDAFAYFTPYRDYANAALRAGRLPLWNPYLFLGVPFLANPQTAIFYPLHWPFVGLPAAQSLLASLALHLWLTGLGAALYVRRVARLGWLAALTTGLIWSLSGYLGARAGQINQASVLAWLPWLLILLEASVPRWRLTSHGQSFDPTVPVVRWLAFAGLALAVALQLLAGHTQSSFINLTGLLLAALWPGLAALLTALWSVVRRQHAPLDWQVLRVAAGRALVVLGAVLLGFMVSAVQLLPTLELSALSIRSGGLSWREAVAFSLQPRGLLLTLFPSYGENLADRFATPAYGEYVAYVGVAGLLLALLALARWRNSAGRRPLASPWGLAAALAVVGFGLALGAFNPLYFVLVKFVPGFDLFRAPARWMGLYTFGVSLLAGYGVAALAQGGLAQPRRHVALRGRQRWLAVALALLVVALLAVQRWPGWLTVALWLVVGLVVAGIALWQVRRPWATLLLIPLLLAELTAASLALEHRRPTAPEAITSLRSAPAHLLAVARQAETEGRIPGRFLSISGITYDPGDLAELEQIFGGHLPQQALYDLVVASKLQEIVAPNLPLLWRLPAADGYDGGVLPLRRYVDLQTLFVPPGELAEDGRLREQLEAVPPSRLLRLLGVEHVLTDKGFDVWRDGVYYDLELSTRLAPGEAAVVQEADRLEATGLGLWSHLDGGAALPDGAPVAEVLVEGAGGSATLLLRAGLETAEGLWSSDTLHTQPAARQPWPREQAGWDYLARADWVEPLLPQRITVRNVAAEGDLMLRGVSLLDERTGSHAALTVPADGQLRRVHSGDVKIYQNLQALPRAYVAGQVTVAADDAVALAALADPSFEPADQVVLLAEELAAAGPLEQAAQLASPAVDAVVQVVSYQPEQIELDVTLDAPGVLVLADTWYPGWQA
ncbi:MAG TPA: hypothetical protein VL334_04745, partial [Anaerolineae bacterium]|nr:hypothetical protein [Anaerolineae bacterium]